MRASVKCNHQLAAGLAKMRSRPLSSLILMQHGPDMARVLIRLVSRQAGSRCR